VQKWSPDEFTDTIPSNPAPGSRWNRLSIGEKKGEDPSSIEMRFQKETQFVDPGSLLLNLTQEERTLIFELAEQDVAREYEEREVELKAELEKQLADARSDYEKGLGNWARDFGESFSKRNENELGEIGKAAAELAVQLAGKIIRSLVPLDEQILVRGIKTALFKFPGNQHIRLIAHPDDVAWLSESPDFLEKLNISEVRYSEWAAGGSWGSGPGGHLNRRNC